MKGIMSMMSIRDFNANVSRALAQAEAGEDVLLTRNAKPVLRITKEIVEKSELERQRAIDALRELMRRGIDLGGPATYEERTGLDRLPR